ncbi:MAG: ABC transporter ATP-binding protein [Anaerolineales bacterium]
MSAIIEVHNLHKTYRKAKRPALDGLSFDVEQGAIYAFVGPNGAGKTTTLRILATLLRFDQGEVRVGGYPVDERPRDVRRILGYIPDEFGLYEELNAVEYLDFFAACYGIAPERRPAMIADLLDLVGLAHRAADPVRTLSRGMRQRLGLARALVHDPALIIADEPAAGLDPRARVELREILAALQEMGKTILLSSHVLRELDEIATHLGIIEAGTLVASGPIDEIRMRLQPQRTILVTFLGSTADAHAWLTARPDVAAVEVVQGSGEEVLRVTLQGQEDAVVALLAALVQGGWPVRSYLEERATLESLFLDLTRGIVS